MKLADLSIRRPVLATVMVGVLVVFGVTSYPKIGVDLMPDVEFPFVTITVVYPGADPETIESKVLDKLEEAVSTVNGIKMLRSTAMENVGFVVIQFELERKADQAIQDVRDKVSSALRTLPKDLEPPVVEKLDINAAPILMLALSGPQSRRELTRIADKVVKQSLQAVPGVGGVDLVGGQVREFHVWIDPERLESQWLSVMDVLQALAAQNVEIPGGRLDTPGTEFTVKTRGQVHSAREIENLIITGAGGAPIRIGSVARVEDGEAEQRSSASLDGQQAIALAVRKQSGANTVEVANQVLKALARLKAQLPKGVTLAVPVDNSTFIRQSMHDVKFDLVFGGVLAIIIILFFLHDWRATFISALALPTSVVATFAFIKAMGYTFNTMTMLALSLSIGILIDDAIVVIENIHRHLGLGKTPMQAASDATDEIGLAVLATTASILAVFVPVATMQGIVGRIFVQFGLTVAFAVSVSLFVAFTLTPMLSARMLRVDHGRKNFVGRGIDWVLLRVEHGYRIILGAALRQRLVTLLVAAGALAGSVLLVRQVPTEFMPPEDRGQFLVRVEKPAGTSFPATRDYVEAVATQLRRVTGVTSTFVTVAGGTGGEVNKAEIQVTLVPRRKRAFTQQQALEHVRDLLADRKDAVFSVEKPSIVGGGQRQNDIQFQLRGNDYRKLNDAAQKLIAALRKQGGYVDLDTTYRGGKPEVGVRIDRDRASDLDVPIASLAMTVRSLMAGDKATEIPTDGERFDVRVKLDAPFRTRAEDLLNFKVRAISGGLVQLGSVVTLDPGTGPASIERQNRQRQVTVLANLKDKALGPAMKEIDQIARKVVPPDITTGWTGMGEIMTESFANLGAALILAVLIVYLVLAAQFESFLHPFTIMLSLPLSLVGAIGALALAKQSLGIMGMIGIILLMGLVTKNAILLVDYTNTLREQGQGKTEALLAAGPVRLRPILMTTAAMIFGMIPVALALSEGGEMRQSMAIAVIGGLITSTLLTLVVVPVVYSLLDAAAERILGKRQVQAEPADPDHSGSPAT